MNDSCGLSRQTWSKHFLYFLSFYRKAIAQKQTTEFNIDYNYSMRMVRFLDILLFIFLLFAIMK